MRRTSVESSSIREVGYDAEAMVLEVQFVNGSVYQYYDVSEDLYGDFMRADSMGAFFNTHIKDTHSFLKL